MQTSVIWPRSRNTKRWSPAHADLISSLEKGTELEIKKVFEFLFSLTWWCLTWDLQLRWLLRASPSRSRVSIHPHTWEKITFKYWRNSESILSEPGKYGATTARQDEEVLAMQRPMRVVKIYLKLTGMNAMLLSSYLRLGAHALQLEMTALPQEQEWLLLQVPS